MERIIQEGRVPGLLAYYEGRPVAWTSVAPRDEFPVLDRSRTLRPVDDAQVWSITCFFVSAPHRRKGISTQLVRAAVDYAAACGARIVEAYPIVREAIRDPHAELYMGELSTFLDAGFAEVARRSHRRAIVRFMVPCDPTH
jgi:GNAT superfamily N-acetyltransferase